MGIFVKTVKSSNMEREREEIYSICFNFRDRERLFNFDAAMVQLVQLADFSIVDNLYVVSNLITRLRQLVIS